MSVSSGISVVNPIRIHQHFVGYSALNGNWKDLEDIMLPD